MSDNEHWSAEYQQKLRPSIYRNLPSLFLEWARDDKKGCALLLVSTALMFGGLAAVIKGAGPILEWVGENTSEESVTFVIFGYIAWRAGHAILDKI